MKFRIIYTLFALLFGGFLFLNSSSGRATSQLEGNTGAPNDNNASNRTCQTCHNNGSFQVTPMLEIMDSGGNIVTSNFNSGETYSVKMTVNATGSPAGYGFQILSLNAASGMTGTPVNTWVVPTGINNVQTATIANGRQYAEHKSISSSNEFLIEWTAPASGDVTFYFGGNAVNENNNTSGDNAIMGSMAFTIEPTATNDLEKIVALSVFPNPVNEVINLRTNSQVSDTYDLFLFDQNGRQISIQKLNIPSGENISPINVMDWSTGIYNLILSDGQNQIAKKIVKL